MGQESNLHPAVLECASPCPQASIVVFWLRIIRPISTKLSILVHIRAPGLVSRWGEMREK
jgi:hypothetical protein